MVAGRRPRSSGCGSGRRRGYVCVSFDFTGPWQGRKDVTDWGPITQANLEHANGGLQIRPTPRSSSWYHWALVARRALTVLSYHPKVDRERLGIFGVSIGGTLCWLVAATDERVKTAVPIYGCGYNFDKHKTAWGFPELEPAVVLFKRVLAPKGTPRRFAVRCSCWTQRMIFTVGWTTPTKFSGKSAGRGGSPSRRATTTISTMPKATTCRRGWIGNSKTARRSPPSRK